MLWELRQARFDALNERIEGTYRLQSSAALERLRSVRVESASRSTASSGGMDIVAAGAAVKVTLSFEAMVTVSVRKRSKTGTSLASFPKLDASLHHSLTD